MGQAIRIFLLEDDQDLREALESVLELEGYEVIAAADGSEAVSKAAENPFDIIVFDVKLPGPDGLEVFAQFKRENPDLLSVVMTGYATEQDTLRALRLGVGDYLKKPFKSQVLIEAVRRLEASVLRRRKLEESERASQKLMTWSLEFLTGALELAKVGRGLSLVECGRVAEKLARSAGFPNETSQALQSAILYRALQRFGESDERAREFQAILPSTVTALISQMEEVDESRELDPDSLSELGLMCERLVDDSDGLLILEKRLGVSVGGSVPKRQGRERRQLLSLGRSLAASGEAEAAREAFTKVAEGSRSPEAGQGLLELARLAWAKGDKAQVKAQLRAIVELLPQLGPQAGCQLQIEAGLTALSMNLQGGKPLLESSLKTLERLNIPGLHHLSILGIKASEEQTQPLNAAQLEALQFQLDHGLFDLLVTHADWFLQAFLGLQLEHPHPTLKRLMLRVVQNAPRSVGRLLDPELEEQKLDLLLAMIESVGASGFVASLERFFAQCKSKETKSRVDKLLSSVSQQEAPSLRLYSLGPFEVWIGDHRLSEKAWRTYRSRFLLACLASRQGKPLLAETVIEQFWPGAKPESGKKNLSQTASDLRKTLAESGFELADDLLFRKHDMISLNQDYDLWHDVDSFRDQMEKARREIGAGRNRVAHHHLRQAFSLVRGEYLEDCPMEWVINQRREFERLATDCCELLTKTCIELGHHPEAIEVANAVLDKDPCHQPLHILVMQAQAAMGRPELALRQFERAEKALRVELGVEPSTDLLRAHQIAKMAL